VKYFIMINFFKETFRIHKFSDTYLMWAVSSHAYSNLVLDLKHMRIPKHIMLGFFSIYQVLDMNVCIHSMVKNLIEELLEKIHWV